VEPRFAGKPPDGLHARPVRVEPSTILVRGAETAVQPMRVVETQPIDVSGLERGRHRRTASTERAPLHTEFDDRAVDVVFELAPRQAERTLEDLEISAVGPRRVRMQPSRVDVTLWGTSKQLERLDRGRIIPYVQLSKLNLSGSAEEASVRVRGVPPGIDWRTMPSSVLVQPAPRGSDGSDDEG
jgi:YbbR domain-containing protein